MNTFIVVEEPSPFNPEETIKRIEMVLPDGRHFSVPDDPANSDYQAYLRWLENPDAEEGGTL